MAETLVESMAKLQLASAVDSLAGANDDEWIDSILDLAPPRTKQAQDVEGMKAELERKYLTPSTTFSEPWLNRLQQYVVPSSNLFIGDTNLDHGRLFCWQHKRLARTSSTSARLQVYSSFK